MGVPTSNGELNEPTRVAQILAPHSADRDSCKYGAFLVYPAPNASSVRQAEIVSALEALGVNVGYSHEWDEVQNCYSGADIPGGPLRRILGNHFFLNPNLILASEFQGKASALRGISQLKGVTSFGIVDSPNIGDEIVNILLALPKLEDASLYATAVTSNGAVRLKDHPTLDSIVLSHTQVLENELDDLRRAMPRCTIYWDDEPNVSVSELLAIEDNAAEQQDEREPE